MNPANNRLKLAARGRPVAEWQAAHARRSFAGALDPTRSVVRAASFYLVLLVFSASAFTGAVLTTQPTLLVCGSMGILFLLASIAAVRRPLPATLRSFQNHAVVVQLWGTPPSVPGGADLIVGSVNVIGAGLHVFFTAGPGRPIHLKVAQPRDTTLSSDGVVINLAKYVQWSGTTLPRAEGAPAVVVSLKERSVPNDERGLTAN